MHLFEIYLAFSVMLFGMGSPIGVALIELIAKDRLPRPFRRHSLVLKLALGSGVETLALALFMVYAWITFDPIIDRVFAETMKMYFRHIGIAIAIQCAAWPAILWLLAREPRSHKIRRSVLAGR
ncbi:MAG: hypothetical protein ACEQSB_04005 [Undibacterium sp.]